MNMIYGRMQDAVAPAPGVRCTMISWSDRDPCVISRVSKTGSRVWVRHLEYAPAPGVCNAFTEDQRWVIADLPSSSYEVEYTRRKNGAYVRKGIGMGLSGSGRLLIGTAMVYRDPSF